MLGFSQKLWSPLGRSNAVRTKTLVVVVVVCVWGVGGFPFVLCVCWWLPLRGGGGEGRRRGEGGIRETFGVDIPEAGSQTDGIRI